MKPGEKLKRVRRNLPGDPTPYEVDEALGFTKGRTQSYERGSAKPSREYLEAFEKAYGIPGSVILDPSDEDPLVTLGRGSTMYTSETTVHRLPENTRERLPVPGASPYLVP